MSGKCEDPACRGMCKYAVPLDHNPQCFECRQWSEALGGVWKVLSVESDECCLDYFSEPEADVTEVETDE